MNLLGYREAVPPTRAVYSLRNKIDRRPVLMA